MSKAVLLVNLGSPDSPAVGDVRRYLNEFLMDGRVIDKPWPLRRLLGVRGQPTFAHRVFWPRAIPQYNVGYGRFRTLMTAIEKKAPGLLLAGSYRDGISLGDSIVSGANVAERVIGEWKSLA